MICNVTPVKNGQKNFRSEYKNRVVSKIRDYSSKKANMATENAIPKIILN